MSNDKKKTWYESENIVAEYYSQKGFTIIQQNYTVQDWELDLIIEDSKKLIFVEVKTVDQIDDLFDYITPRKLSTVKRTIQTYLWKNPTQKDIRLDVVFVKNKQVFEVYENIE